MVSIIYLLAIFNMDNPQNTGILQSKVFKGILYGLGIAIVLFLVFEVGMTVGYQKAMFSYRWVDHYQENFMPRGDFSRPDKGFINPHGAMGDIIKIDSSLLTIKGPDEVEKPVLLKSDTAIERGFDIIKPSDLKVGDHVIVIGAPNDSGQVEAKLLRVMPDLSGK